MVGIPIQLFTKFSRYHFFIDIFIMHVANKYTSSVKPGAKHNHHQRDSWKHDGNKSIFEIHILCVLYMLLLKVSIGKQTLNIPRVDDRKKLSYSTVTDFARLRGCSIFVFYLS